MKKVLLLVLSLFLFLTGCFTNNIVRKKAVLNQVKKKERGLVVTDNYSSTNEKEKKYAIKENNYALIVGCQEYSNRGFKRLPTIKKDLNALSEILTEEYNYNLIGNKIYLNIDRGSFIKLLEKCENNLGENDNLLIYYSGHSEVVNNKLFWKFSDAKQKKRYSWISEDDLRISSMKIPSRHLLILANSTYPLKKNRSSKRGLKIENQNSDYILKKKIRRSRMQLLSGGIEEIGTLSIFTRALTDILKNNNGILGANSLNIKVEEKTKQLNSKYNLKFEAIKSKGAEKGDDDGQLYFEKKQ